MFAAAVAWIHARHGLRGPFTRARDGFHTVFLGPDRAIKLFAPFAAADCKLERTALTQVAGRLPVETPTLCGDGELDGWSYLVMTRLSGQPALDAWPSLTPAQREQLVADLGRLAAALHGLSLDAFEQFSEDWCAYMKLRRASMLQKHRRQGVDSQWLADIEQFVAGLPAISTWPVRRVLLHNDLRLGHLHVDSNGRLSGLLDFGDVQVGAAEVEFTSIGGFISPLYPRAMSVFLQAYGYPRSALTPVLARRLTGYVLLHRYCELVPLIGRFPRAVRPNNLAALHRLLWDFGSET